MKTIAPSAIGQRDCERDLVYTSNQTAKRRTNPLIVCCQSTLTPMMDMPLLSTAITNPPTMVPITVPIPPDVEAPPMKQAPIASSSNPLPAFGVAALSRPATTRPATAASTPILT